MLEKLVADDPGVRSRPYLAIAYASILYQLEFYEAAAIHLEQWLDFRQIEPLAWYEAASWLKVRAQSILAGYADQWLIRANGAALVRNEYLKNQERLRKGLKDHLWKKPYFAALLDEQNGRDAGRLYRKPEYCELGKSSDVTLWRYLFSSYVSTEARYAYARINHPEYKGFWMVLKRELSKLASLDLSCIQEGGTPSPLVAHAEILGLLGSNAISYAKMKDSEFKDEGKFRW
jgi:hypothetical protein